MDTNKVMSTVTRAIMAFLLTVAVSAIASLVVEIYKLIAMINWLHLYTSVLYDKTLIATSLVIVTIFIFFYWALGKLLFNDN